ncbi:MAG: PAS domain S-box protein [Rubrivivax sp.]
MTTPDPTSSGQAPLDPALCAEQNRLHGRTLWLSVLIAWSVALIVGACLRQAVPAAALGSWLALVAAATALRLAVHRGLRAPLAADPANPRWRQRYRWAAGLQGLAWSSGALLLAPLPQPSDADVLAMALLGTAAGGLMSLAFDRVAALLYALPSLLAVLAWLPGRAMPASLPLMGALLIISVVLMLRSQRAFVEAAALRREQAAKTAELRRVAEQLDRTGAIAGVGGWALDAATRQLELSPHALRLLDLPPDARLGMDECLAMLDPADRDGARAAIDGALAEGRPFTATGRVRTAQGRNIVLRAGGEPRRVDGRIVGLDGAVQDVTRSHDADRRLADERRLLLQLLRSARQGFWFLDADGRCTELNPAMAELLGRPREALLGLDALTWFDGEDRARLAGELQACRRQPSRPAQDDGIELSLHRPDGSRRRCLVQASPLLDGRERLIGSVSTWTDISGRHQVEEALRVSQFAINASTELISVIDEFEVYHDVNDAWCRSMGLRREQVIGHRLEELVPGVLTPARVQGLMSCLREARITQVRNRVQLPGQPPRVLHTSYYPIVPDEGRARMAAIVTRDVTQEEEQHAAMVAASEYLRGTLEATSEAIFATDADHDDEPARFANDQLFRLWRLDDSLRRGLTTRQLMAHIRPLLVDGEAQEAHMEAIVAAGVPVEERLHLRDGRVLTLRFACATVHGRKLRVWSSRDITGEAAAQAVREAAAAEQRALLDNFPGFIAVLDGEQRYQYVNERLARLLGLPTGRIVGRPAAEVLGPERWRKLRLVLEAARRNGQATSGSQHPGTDGRGPVEMEVTHVAGPPQADGTRPVYAFGIDVTERKRAQAALIDALSEAERANKAKSQFLSSMSHELRTPLNAVLGFGQLLAQQDLGPDQRRQVDEILRGGRHLLGLIGDLLDLGRIEAGELEMVPGSVSAAALADECVALMQPLAAEHAVRLQPPAGGAGLHAWADPKRLRQVLLNLLSNAIKYNRRGGEVGVSIAPADGQLEFRVTDDGPGLSAEQQSRLFKPFERLDAARSGADGTGIGLALSRHLVEAMGGRIGVVSQPGQGSSFWFRLPLAEAAPAAATPAPAAPAERRRRALYIEDNPVNLMLMAALLERELDLATEADPLQGLAQAQAAPPDLILLDIQLPGIDGYEVLRRLRADERTRRIPVVAVSANAMPADLAAGKAAGFDAYLTKPVELHSLLETVRALAPPAA